MQIALITKSANLSSENLAWLARACDAQMREDFAPAYGFEAWPVCDYSTLQGVDASLYHPIYMLDNIGVDGALGFHDDIADLIYGRVHVDAGVNTTSSHEVLEMRADPECNLWIPIPDHVASSMGMAGSHWTVAYEACDAVEGDSYTKTVTMPITGETQDLLVSNFVLPSWYDETGSYPYDKMGLLQAPFTMTQGGYLILRNSKTGVSTNVFASTGEMAAVAHKLTDPDSRTYRRMNP